MLLPFGDYRPDISSFKSKTSQAIFNVEPRADGFGPHGDLAAFSGMLPTGACRGYCYGRLTDGSVQIFAGSATRLYQFNATTFGWTDVSLPAPILNVTSTGAGAGGVVQLGLSSAPTWSAGDFVTVAGVGGTTEANGTFQIDLPGGNFINLRGTTFVHAFTAGGTVLGPSSYAAPSANANWQFFQFGSKLYALHANVVLQVFDMASAVAFAVAPGTPPQAAYGTIVGQFVVLSGLLSAGYRIQWSGLGDPTNWVAGVNQSDFQDFPDGGIVRGVAGGEYGVIMQDIAIRNMVYAPGSPTIFTITRISEDMGLFAPYALVRAGENIYFPSTKGFQLIEPGSLPQQIGKGRVDETFFADVDGSNIQLCIGAADPTGTRIYFAYKSVNGLVGLYDKMLLYDTALDRWTHLRSEPGNSISGQYLGSLAKPGLTLEQLDLIATGSIAITSSAASPVGNGLGGFWTRLLVATEALPVMPAPPDGAPVPTVLAVGQKLAISGVVTAVELNKENITINLVSDGTHIDVDVTWIANGTGGRIAGALDAMTESLDAFATASAAAISGFNALGQLGFFSGPNLQAELQTADQGGDGNQRLFLTELRPQTDAPGCYASVGRRENLQTDPAFTPEVLINSLGICGCGPGISARYARAKLRIPYATAWKFALGIEPIFGADGER